MIVKRNPKQEGTPYFDCIPQSGACPLGCAECFFNRPGAYYVPLDQLPLVPTPEEVGDGIVRMNCGNDSNNQKDLVIATAEQYKQVFFNTSIRNLDFPGPVVLTANPREEEPAWLPFFAAEVPRNLMFVRLRVSGTNLGHIDDAVRWWTQGGVPVVLTFMAYYTERPKVDEAEVGLPAGGVLRVAGPPYQLVLVRDESLHADGARTLREQPAGVHVRQHRLRLLPHVPQLRKLLPANPEETAG